MLGRRVFYTFDGEVGGDFCTIVGRFAVHIRACKCGGENVARSVTTSC